MKNTLYGLLFLAASAGTPLSAQNLIPMPQKVEWGKKKVNVEKVRWTVSEEQLGKGASRILKEILPPTSDKGGSPVLCLKKAGTAESNEAYSLRVTPDSIIISATKNLGILRAAQTLKQITENGSVTCCNITDTPAFEWRGAMLDCSRHFLSIEFLRKHIDLLSTYKINRLHLHLTDAAGWRMEIKRYPRLTNFAAWRPQASWKAWWAGNRHYVEEGTPGAYGGYYTQDELRELVAYAEERGITIIPEIEMPAHSEEVLTAYPELSCTHEPYKQADFCPGSVATYDFLEHVLEEVMDVFPSQYIHVGGDEAGKASWSSCPLCQHKMKELGLKNADKLQPHLIAHMARFLKAHGRTLIGWDEITDPTLPKDAVVMVWRGAQIAGDAARLGNDVVMCPGTHCYFDFYQDAPPTQPQAIGGFTTLERVYSFNPTANLTPEELKHIKGVQGNVWAEYIETPEHREYMLYPRILAIAETGWHGTEGKNYEKFHERAALETDRLRASGVNAFNLRTEIGERKTFSRQTKHKAFGAKVIYNLPYSNNYPASGDHALTDGYGGGWDNNDGRWQGFINGERFDVTIDLGKPTSFKSVSTDFIQSCGPEIYFPAEYIVSVSNDGKTFKELCHQQTPVVKTDNPDVRTWSWKGKAKGRYVRVQAKAGEFGGWLFADEVTVK